MGRSILGVVAGLVIGIVIVGLVETLGMRLFPLPADVDPTDPSALAAAIPSLPIGAFLFVLGAWFLGAWTGATTAMRIGRGTARWPGITVGALIVAAALYNLWVIPHPTWFTAVAVVGLALITWVASRPVGAIRGAAEG